ncbi:MAG TPA: glycerate kinase [Caulobacterales bacterium]|jgi:hydroxypyruvate reductase|nr:glycerate kinase [Caulobacterales bacterium]
MSDEIRKRLRALFDAGVRAADPRKTLPAHLPARPKGRCVVVGAGKASALMAAALEEAWSDVALTGVVVTRYGHAVPTTRIEILEAAHPVPDAASVHASERILGAVRGLTADDLVLALISGGGSSLLTLPAEGLTLADKQRINAALLSSGAPIGEMNLVRKHLSRIKGGRLALAAAPARVVTLVISDVPGDDPATIASGPTAPDLSRGEDALAVLDRYEIDLPAGLRKTLEAPRASTMQSFTADIRMIASPAMSLNAVADEARRLGWTPLILGDAIEGESAGLGVVMAGIARSVRDHGLPVAAPAVLLSGGETTVTLRGAKAGRGGRNTEFLLSLARQLSGMKGVWAIAGDSDGIDGTEDAAGAIVSPDTLDRARASGLDAASMLRGHDSYSFFAGLGDLVITGPTLTNVNDLRAVVIT